MNRPGRANELAKERRSENPDKFRKQGRDRRSRNIEHHRKLDKIAYAKKRASGKIKPRTPEQKARNSESRRRKYWENPELFRAKANASYRDQKKTIGTWTERNRDRANARARAWRAKKKASSPLFRFSCNLRSTIHKSIRRIGGKKSKTTMRILGCSIPNLMTWISAQFELGMSWDNYGISTWHIDHRTPLSSATTVKEIEALWHHTNLRPMWGPENIAKSDFLPCGARARHKLQQPIV